MSEVKLIINKLNDAPRLFIDGQEAKGIVSIDYKYVTSGGKEQLGAHHYAISYVDDLDVERFNADPTIKTITVKKLYEDKSNYEQLIKAEGSE